MRQREKRKYRGEKLLNEAADLRFFSVEKSEVNQ
jgi:hypothetical protein